MNSDTAVQTLLRALPAIAVFVLGFIAVNDVKTRRQWTSFLYSVGSLRADQREDAHKQATVKFPFFLFAVILLWWPISYYRHATRPIETATEAELFKKPEGSSTPTPKPTTTPKPTPTPMAAPPPPGESAHSAPAPAASAPVAQSTPAAAKTPPPDSQGSGPHL